MEVSKCELRDLRNWKRKRKHRPGIADDVVLLTITREVRVKDARWEGVLNSSLRVPQSGRTLKVVYRVKGPRKYRIITAYWLD